MEVFFYTFRFLDINCHRYCYYIVIANFIIITLIWTMIMSKIKYGQVHLQNAAVQGYIKIGKASQTTYKKKVTLQFWWLMVTCSKTVSHFHTKPLAITVTSTENQASNVHLTTTAGIITQLVKCHPRTRLWKPCDSDADKYVIKSKSSAKVKSFCRMSRIFSRRMFQIPLNRYCLVYAIL